MDVTIDSEQLDYILTVFWLGVMAVCFCIGLASHEGAAK